MSERVYKICLSFVGGVLLSSLLTRVITLFIKVDDAFIDSVIKQYPVSAEDVLPEPWEMTGFFMFWIFFAAAFLIIYGFMDKRISCSRNMVTSSVALVLTIIGTYILFTAEEDFFYINMSWFMKWYGAVASVVLFGGLFFLSKKKSIDKVIDVAAVLIISISSVFCFVRNPLFGTNAFHFNGYFTTIYNVFNGATLGVDSKIIYGTYAYLFLPIYKVIGLSLTSYALITMLMCFGILLCEYYVIRNLIDNSVIRLAVILVCVYINVFFAVNAHYEQFITQHFPMRVFFPMVMLAYVVWTSKHKSILDKKRIICGIFICYMAFMMNLESAVTTSLTWASACFYFKMSVNENKRDLKETIAETFLSALKYIFGVALAFLCWVLTIELICFVRVGDFIRFSELYSTQVVFSKAGYGMLPLPDYLHIYVFIFILYALFLGVGIQRIFFEGKGYYLKDQIAFGVSVTGILMCIYYMGRTHNRSLFTWLCPCVMLLAYILDNIIVKMQILKEKWDRICIGITGAIIAILLCVYAMSSGYVVLNSDLYRDFIKRQVNNNYDERIVEEIDFLKKYEVAGTVNYIGNHVAGIALAAGLRNNFLGEMAMCWYSWDDYEYIKEFIQSCDGNIIIDGTAASQINKYIPKEFEKIMSDKEYCVIDESSTSKVWGKTYK